jgi:DNA gyrase subunit B
MIEELDGVLAIRKRPGMYIGDVYDGSGLLHLLWEVVANAVDEHLAGACKNIAIRLHDDARVTVEDDGRGIPVLATQDGLPFLEAAMTHLHTRPTFDGHVRNVHVKVPGVGLVAVNALSRETIVETVREGRRYRQVFRAGPALGPLADLGDTRDVGTRITFTPDPSIFEAPEFDATQIRERLRQIAGFCAGLTFRFADERRDAFVCPRGIVDLLAHESRGGSIAPDPVLHARGEEGNVRVEVALGWCRWHGRVRSFVNLHETSEGGSHVTGLERGMSELANALPESERPDVERALRAHMLGILSVFHHDPSFENPTKSRLATPEVRPVVEAVVRRCLRDFAASRPDDVQRLLEAMKAWG